MRGGRPFCYCQKRCHTLVKNVCGSDGKMYSSDCGLRIISCRTGVHIKIAPRDHCSKSGRCNGVVCKPYAKCVNGQCLCPKICPPQYSPVCGSDGQTYSSKCHMEIEACAKDKKITVVSKSACTCSYSRPYASCKVIQAKQFCYCNFQNICHSSNSLFPQYHGPVCGWTGRYRKSFSSECRLKILSCFTNQQIRVLHKGRC